MCKIYFRTKIFCRQNLKNDFYHKLYDELAMHARVKGVTLSINTNEHALGFFRFMKLGPFNCKACVVHHKRNSKYTVKERISVY
jgi:hypothetical protein